MFLNWRTPRLNWGWSLWLSFWLHQNFNLFKII